MKSEMGLDVKRTRVLYNQRYYPIHYVLFERAGTLGFFDPNAFQVGIHKSFLHNSDEGKLMNVLRHELAHFALWLQSGESYRAHGPEFRALCQSFGWNKDVFQAREIVPSEACDRTPIVSKVKKLLNLASSSNSHEAELATLKANEIMLKHNLQNISGVEEYPEVFVARVINAKKALPKHQAIYEILKTFFVHPVYNYTTDGFHLEITGTLSNVEIGDYVAGHLDTHLENLWDEVKKENMAIRGQRAKKSFMMGIAEGYKSKIKKVQSNLGHSKELILLEKQLTESLHLAYPNLRNKRSFVSETCHESKNLGQKKGASLSIRPSLKNLSKIKLLS